MQDDDENANTALHLAAMNGQIDCVKALILGGAHIGARFVIKYSLQSFMGQTSMNFQISRLEKITPMILNNIGLNDKYRK